jgi:thiamine biosynthesis lipoprotein
MAFREIRRLERLFSIFRADSEISRVNRAAGDTAVRVDAEVVQLLERAREYSTATGGKVDVTIDPLMRLWGFREEGHGRRCIPTDPEIDRAIDCVGFKNLILDTNANTVGLAKRGAALDLGGIAVGYAVDRAASIIRECGIQSAFINHSGDAYAIGTPPDSDGWEVVIPHPLQPSEPFVRRRLSDRAISTSGNYEKFVLLDGVRWGHIVDPLSGWPADKLLGMTVIAPDANTADAFSTGLFCMNQRETRDALRMTQDIEAISVVASDDDVVMHRCCSE